MTDQPRLDDLVGRWLEQRQRGLDPSVSDLCASCPELLPELKRRLRMLEGSGQTRESSDQTRESFDQTIGAFRTENDFIPTVSANPSEFPGYEVLAELGRGGMGVVYRARDLKSGQLVALKTLQGLTPQALFYFKQEFRSLADVSHPNLVVLHELISDGRVWFFTMDLVEGVDFLSHVRLRLAESLANTDCRLEPTVDSGHSTPRPNVGRLRDALRQLCEGVAALHRAGKIHRDIKPHNIMVTPAGRVVLLDFGLAADLGPAGWHQSTATHIVGTANYMSPEQAAGQPVSPATDWYGVGVILYEALTGRVPFDGSVQQVLLDKARLDPPVPADVVAGPPGDLSRLCMELLRREPRDRPTGEEIVSRLGGASIARATVPDVVNLVGREPHLQALADAFAAVRYGRPVVMSVDGQSGAGKSALVQEFLEGLSTRGDAVVLAGKCYEQESVPYKALDGVVDTLSRLLARLPKSEVGAILPRDVRALVTVFPVLGRVEAVASAPARVIEIPDRQELRRRAFEAMRELLARIGDRGPLVVAIDDFQWGDRDSAALLEHVLRPPDPPALLLLLCCRSEDLASTPWVQTFMRPSARAGDVDRRELNVEPLTPTDARRLALMLLGPDAPDAAARAEAISRESGGNPFFVWELSHAARTGRGVAGIVSAAEGSPSLSGLLWERVLELPEQARRLLEIVAVADAALPKRLACNAAGLGADNHAYLAALRSARLVRPASAGEYGSVAAYHDRVREAVIAHLAPDDVIRHHKSLATTLEASGEADPELLSVHFHGAGLRDKAGHYYAAAAAKAAESLAFDHAAAQYRLALEVLAEDDARRRRLHILLAGALGNAGYGVQSAAEYLASIAGAEGLEAIDLQRRAAFQLLICGQVDEGKAVLRRASASLGLNMPTGPRRTLLTLGWLRLQVRLRGFMFRSRTENQVDPEDLARIDLCWSATVGLGNIDALLGACFQCRGLLLALRAGEPSRVILGLAAEAMFVAATDSTPKERATKLIARAEALLDSTIDQYPRAIVLFARGMISYQHSRWSAALTYFDQTEKVLLDGCVGCPGEIAHARVFATYALQYLGNLTELRRRVRLILQEAHEHDNDYSTGTSGTYAQSVLWLAADEPEQADCETRSAMTTLSRNDFHVQHFLAMFSLVSIDLYRGDGRAAWGVVSERQARFERSPNFRAQFIRILTRVHRGRAALAAALEVSDPRSLLDTAETDATRLRSAKSRWPMAMADMIEAGAAAVRGDEPRAVAHLQTAVKSLDAVEMRLDAAAARRRLGELVGGNEGRALIAEAGAWMSGQGIVNPVRMTAMLAPGFRSSASLRQ